MSEARYHIKTGDLLHNPLNGVFGIVTKLTRKYVHFHMLGKGIDVYGDFHCMSSERANKKEVYYNIDNGHLFIYYGSQKRRRKRPLVDSDNSLF